MKSFVAEVVDRARFGEHYYSLRMVLPDVDEDLQPGQFVNVRCGDARSSILRRPFSIARLRSNGSSPEIEIMFDIRGAGTAFLADRARGWTLEVLGPLGTGFRIPDARSSCLLVGGGIGAAPLFFLADRLREEGHRVDFLLGARRADLLLEATEAERLATGFRVTTEDGSAGDRGRVTDVMPDMIRAGATDVVFACGPHPMLAAVTAQALESGVSTQAAVEELMACGWGVCMTCVMPVRDYAGDDDYTYRRSCTEGPVFDGASILWDGATSTVPGGTELVPAGVVPVHPTLPEPADEHAPPGN